MIVCRSETGCASKARFSGDGSTNFSADLRDYRLGCRSISEISEVALPEFSWSTRVDAPVDSVARFHARPGLIRQLTPPVTPLSLHRVEPLAEGAVAEFTIWFGPVPIRWTALHVDVDPHSGFTDAQLLGPFSVWRHEHRYERHIDGGTLIVDRIKYRHKKGWRGLLTRTLFSRPMLSLLFAYRSFVYRRSLNSRTASTLSLPGAQG